MNARMSVLFATSMAVVVAGAAPSAMARELPSGTELRAFLNDTCVISDEPYYLPSMEEGEVPRSLVLSSLIAGKLAAALVDGLIQLTASGLDAKSRPKDMHDVEAVDFNMYRVSVLDSPDYTLTDRLTCLTVVAGEFEPQGSDCVHRYVPKTVSSGLSKDTDLSSAVVREDRSVENVLRRANICVQGESRSVYEGRFRFSDDRTAFRLETEGMWVKALLSTDRSNAERFVIYTLYIEEPGTDTTPRTLVSAAVPIGRLKPGLEVEDGARLGVSDWLQVPPMSIQAQRAYERDTAVHQDVFAEIQSLERSIARNKRLLKGLERRFSAASDGVRASLQEEMDDVELKLLRMESLLEARIAEYDELPKLQRKYMPVTIGVGVIESRSEKRALRSLAAFLETHSAENANMGDEAPRFERSMDLAAGEPDPASGTLESAREAYFDALVAAEEARAVNSKDTPAAEERLLQAREAYNRARAEAGIPEIE